MSKCSYKIIFSYITYYTYYLSVGLLPSCNVLQQVTKIENSMEPGYFSGAKDFDLCIGTGLLFIPSLWFESIQESLLICDWIWKNRPKSYNNWNTVYSILTSKLHSSTIQANQTYGYRWPSLLSQRAFADPVKPWGCTIGPVEPLSSINNDVCGAKLQQITTPGHLKYSILEWVIQKCFVPT